MHNRYNGITKESDIALMHLQTPVNYTGTYTHGFISTDVGFYRHAKVTKVFYFKSMLFYEL